MNCPSDPTTFRRILSHYPTGVCVVTGVSDDGKPVGMAVGSFTSVSLNPPLVAFFPDRSSTSWPKIKAGKRFCVNVLAEHQEPICKTFASKAEDKFVDVPYRLSNAGMPVLQGVLAWIDCDLYGVHEAGDHFIAIGKVHSLAAERPGRPLLFCQGSYGQFEPKSEQASS